MAFKYDILLATGIYPPDIGGPATYCKLLNEELPKRGYSVKILSFGELRSKPKIIRHFLYGWKVWRMGRLARVIYVQDPVSVGLPVMMACFFARRLYVLKIVGDYAWEQGNQRFGVKDFLDDFSQKNKGYSWPVLVLKKIQKKVADRAEKIITPSEYLKRIITNWGVSADKIKVIYNAFDEPIGLPSKQDLRRDLNLDGQVVVSVGRLVPWKGFEVLIKTIAELSKNNLEIKLLIIGEGPERKELESLINKLKIKNVFLLGRLAQSELLKYLKAADAFVLNTSYEGFSHQLLEAMWCGTPIITTAVGGNVELINNGANGVLIKFNDQIDLSNKLREILSDKFQADYLAKNAQVTIRQFNKERMLGELISEIL